MMFDRLREDIANIMARDPAARHALEVLTCYPGLHAIMAHRCTHWLWQHRLKWLARLMAYVVRSVTGIEIHPAVVMGRRVFIDHGLGVVIGETANIGDDCTIYQGVTLGGTALHKGVQRHPTLAKGVIVGAGAKVLGNFVVGEYAKIGSNAVVVRAVPAGATMVGNPARMIPDHSTQLSGEMAAHLFAAYGVTENEGDPLVRVLHGLIDHAAAQDRQIEKMCRVLNQAGLVCEEQSELDALNVEQLSKLVES